MTDLIVQSDNWSRHWPEKVLCLGQWLKVLAAGLFLASCQVEEGETLAEIPPGYQAASALVREGFLKKSVKAAELDGQKVALWGYLDGGNIFEDSEQTNYWSFKVKANADDAIGESFSVLVPKSPGYLQSIANLRAFNSGDQAPIVLLLGTARTFAAPTNTNRLTGLVVELPEANAFKLIARR